MVTFNSIKKKIIIPTALFFATVVALLTTAMTWQGQEAQRSMLQSKATSNTNFLEKISGTYIVNYDLTALESFVTELGKDPDIAFAEFFDSQKKPLTKKISDNKRNPKLLVIERDIKDDSGKSLGSVVVGYKQDAIAANLQRSIMIGVVSWLVGMVLCVAGLTYIVGTVTNPITELNRVIGAVSRGQLDQRVDIRSQDELGGIAAAINVMSDNLRELIGQIRSSANEIETSAAQFDHTSSLISESSAAQTSSADSTAHSVAALTQCIDEVAASAREAVNLSGEAHRICQEGQKIVRDAAAEMSNIETSVTESSRMVASLGQHSIAISTIIEVIKHVADQTNLLALNAAIEAARAGEQGRGFAVVADEVRSLAKRTSEATSEITAMIDAIQADTKKAIASMEAGSSRVRDGVDFSNRGAEALDRIISSVERSQQSINSIASAAVAQSESTHVIGDNVEKIAAVSKDHRGQVTELLSGARQLQGFAESLQSAVSRFKS